MNPTRELQKIFNSIHNVNSIATMPSEFEFQEDKQLSSENWFDKLVLRWF